MLMKQSHPRHTVAGTVRLKFGRGPQRTQGLCHMRKCVRFRLLRAATTMGVIAIVFAGAPAQASPLVADGITYNLFESTLTPTEHQFTLDITGINAAADAERGRYGVNSLAFGETSPSGSVL